MNNLPLTQTFTLLEPGPVVLVTTHDGHKDTSAVNGRKFDRKEMMRSKLPVKKPAAAPDTE